VVISTLLLALFSACGAGRAVTTASTTTTSDILITTTVASTTAPATTEPPTTTAAAADAAPPDLEGTWRTDRDDRLTLTLRGTSYQLSSALGGSAGDISVDGDRITFSNCNCPDIACLEPGTYQWLIEGDSLTLTSVDPVDPCSGRRDRLAEVDYTR
jgi:hypothetical protein